MLSTFRFRLPPLVLAATRVLVLGALVVMPARSARAQQALEGEKKPLEVARLTIKGVKHVAVSDLQQSLATTGSHCRSLLMKPFCLVTKSRYFYERDYLDETEFRKDVLRVRVFYWKRGWRDATVDTARTDLGHNQVAIEFHVHENPPTVVREVVIGMADSAPGASPLTDRDRKRLLTMRPGDPLNILKLDTAATRVREALWDRGYGDATVATEATADSARNGRVALTYVPRKITTVGNIHVNGNDAVTERTIRRSLDFHEGDVFKRSDVIRSQRSLYESELFKHASIDTTKRSETSTRPDSVKSVVVRVVESPPRGARLSGGFNTVDFVQLDGRFTHYNFMGNARRLDIQATLGNLLASQLNGHTPFRDVLAAAGSERGRFLNPTWQASATIQQRWFGAPENTLAASVFAHRRSAPGIFIDRSYGASGTFTRELAERATTSATYRYERSTVEAGDVYFCVSYGVCDLGTIGSLRQTQALSPAILSAQLDRTNDPLGPTKGWQANAQLEHASTFTLSDYRYNRATAEASYYFRLGGEISRSVLAAHARVGWVGALASTSQALGVDALHPSKRFYAGGASSVRGFGENQLGPRVLTIPADKLRGDSAKLCPMTVAIADCDPGVAGNGDFSPRPTGGTSLLEGNIEYRRPVWRMLIGAVFVDGAIVGSGATTFGPQALGALTKGMGAVTPGIGGRYDSPIGHIRLDLGYHPRSTQSLQVVTEDDSPGASHKLIPLHTPRDYVEGNSFLSRLTLHLSIGEAF